MDAAARKRWMVTLLRDADLIDPVSLVRANCRLGWWTSMSIERVLVELKLLKEADLVNLLATHFNAPALQLADDFVAEPYVLQLRPDWCRRHEALPLVATDGVIGMAMSMPGDLEALDDATRLLRTKVSPRTASSRAIHEWLDREHPESDEDLWLDEPRQVDIPGDTGASSEQLVREEFLAARARQGQGPSTKPSKAVVQMAHGAHVFHGLVDEAIAFGAPSLAIVHDRESFEVTWPARARATRRLSASDSIWLWWWLKMELGAPFGPVVDKITATMRFVRSAEPLSDRNWIQVLEIGVTPDPVRIELRFTELSPAPE